MNFTSFDPLTKFMIITSLMLGLLNLVLFFINCDLNFFKSFATVAIWFFISTILRIIGLKLESGLFDLGFFSCLLFYTIYYQHNAFVSEAFISIGFILTAKAIFDFMTERVSK